jgi:hypothetical protein
MNTVRSARVKTLLAAVALTLGAFVCVGVAPQVQAGDRHSWYGRHDWRGDRRPDYRPPPVVVYERPVWYGHRPHWGGGYRGGCR